MTKLINLKKDKKGFTLVEVIVVLVILAILAAILVPSLSGYIDEANEKVAIAEARAVLMAAQTIASQEYATDPDVDEVDTGDVNELAEVEGTYTGKIVVSGGKVASFTYTSGDNTVYYTKDGGFSTTAPTQTP